MYSNGAFSSFADVQELANDFQRRHCAINEEQVVMVEAGIDEPSRIIDFLVQAHDCGDIVFPEIREICLRRVQRIT